MVERYRNGIYLARCVFNVLVIALLFVGTSASVVHNDVETVNRHIKSDIQGDEEFIVTLDIIGEFPLVVGIVETIPEGFEFPNDDEDVSDFPHFEIDRERRKISFAAIDERDIEYKVIAPSSGEGTFRGKWVDLLILSPELDEGNERLNFIEDVTVKVG
jgi:hypothetical protein